MTKLLIPLSISFLLMHMTVFSALNQAVESHNDTNPFLVSKKIVDNSSLRRKIRDEYLVKDRFRGRISLNSAKKQRIPPALLEQWIDDEIIARTYEVAEKLGNLRKSYPIATALLKRLEKDSDNNNLKRKAQLFFRDFRNEAKNLRGEIDFMISGLPSKPREDSIKESISRKTSIEKLSLLKIELDQADKMIMDYFFTPTTNTIAVKDLKNTNMMIRLYRLEEILKSIERDL